MIDVNLSLLSRDHTIYAHKSSGWRLSCLSAPYVFLEGVELTEGSVFCGRALLHRGQFCEKATS